MTSSHDVPPFAVGDIVETTKGAKFWGQVVSVYRVPKLFSGTDWRCDVYATDPGFEGTLHVYPASQLSTRQSAVPQADISHLISDLKDWSKFQPSGTQQFRRGVEWMREEMLRRLEGRAR